MAERRYKKYLVGQFRDGLFGAVASFDSLDEAKAHCRERAAQNPFNTEDVLEHVASFKASIGPVAEIDTLTGEPLV